MRRYPVRMVAVGAVLAMTMTSCGDSPTVIPSPVPPTTTLAPQPSPSPSPSPSPIQAQCTFAPGPVTRLSISPRELRTDGGEAAVFVRARAGFDEVVCLDRAKAHRLDFNANQRNGAGQESCYEGDVSWSVLSDDNAMVTGSSSRHDDNFIWRYNIEPRGTNGVIAIEAELDGIKSYPWQSGSGYRREPMRIETMNASELARDCLCIFKGNGIWEGARCPKVP